MATQRDRHRTDAMRFDAGAPWLDLLATVGNAYGDAPVERLSTVERFRTWLGREGLTPQRSPSERDLADAHQLREVLRPLGLAAFAGEPLPAEPLRALNATLREDEPLQVRQSVGGLVHAPPRTARVALARVARNAVDTLTGPAAAELGRCRDHDCGMLFLDPGGRRRWCSAEQCGVKHRVRAHRARLRGSAD